MDNEELWTRYVEALNHCVGRNGYDTDCLSGTHHILSIQEDGKSLATLCVDESLAIVDNQFYGRNNGSPSPQAKAAWQVLQEAVKNKTFVLNSMPDDGWGETQESKRARESQGVSALERDIGYRFAEIPEKATQCADHFHTKLHHHVEEKQVRDDKRHKVMGENTKRYITKKFAFGFPIPDFSPRNFDNVVAQCGALLGEKSEQSKGMTL